jgi:hypothetical protein
MAKTSHYTGYSSFHWLYELLLTLHCQFLQDCPAVDQIDPKRAKSGQGRLRAKEGRKPKVGAKF